MRPIVQYIRQYFSDNNIVVFIIITFFAAVLIYCNYSFHIEQQIHSQHHFGIMVVSWYVIFLLAFAMPYLLYGIIARREYLSYSPFILLLLIAPLFFAIRISIPGISLCPTNNATIYWRPVINWSVSLLFILAALLLVWYISKKEQPFYGISKAISLKPYLQMLLLMLPILVWAATRPDFALVYPRLQMINEASPSWWQRVLFELSYSSDFFTIELFFRGFLVMAFARWAGKDAILPMALFYCTIHFGKPLGECISSYFGGIFLGIVVYHTKSIWGGLLVHLGIAWMMEAFGYFLN